MMDADDDEIRNESNQINVDPESVGGWPDKGAVGGMVP